MAFSTTNLQPAWPTTAGYETPLSGLAKLPAVTEQTYAAVNEASKHRCIGPDFTIALAFAGRL